MIKLHFHFRKKTNLLYFSHIFKKLAIGLFALLVILFLNSQVFAATGINKQINFQGKLVNSDSTNVSDGSRTIVFTLYDAASNGTQLWQESDSVTTTDGIFRVSLGAVTALPGSVDFNTDNIYLGIKVGADAEMTPRVQFSAVPYAFNARKVAGLTVTDTTGTLTIPNTKTISFADAFTTSGANPLTLTTSGSTNVTLPTTGTLITNTSSANQTVTSTQTFGTAFSIADSTALSGALIGGLISLTGGNAQDQTGLKITLSGATGTNLNAIVVNDGTNDTAKLSKSGVLSLGNATNNTGQLIFASTGAGNTGTTTFQPGAQSGTSITYTLPTAGAAVNGYVLTSQTNGTLSWTANGAGGGCSTCLQQVPALDADNTITPTADVLGLLIKQTSNVSPTKNIFGVVDSGGTNFAIKVDSSKNLTFGNTTNNNTFSFSGSGTFTTSTGTNTLSGNTTISAGKNLSLASGIGQFQDTFVSGNAAGNAQALAFTNNNANAGVTVGGLDIIPTNNTTPSSLTNTLNVISFEAGTLAASQVTNGINFASATGYTNFLKTPSIIISSAGAITGATGITSATGDITATAGNVAITAGLLSLNGVTRISNTGVGTFITGTVLGSQTFTTNNIVDSGALTIKSGGTSALTLDTSGAAVINLGNTNATSIALGNATTNPTLTLTGSGLTTLGGGLTFSGTTARTITGPATGGLTVNTTSGPLTLSTTTSGTLAVTSAGALNLTGAAASTWSIGSANALTLTSSTIQVSSTGVLSVPGANATADITTITAGNGLTIQPLVLTTASGTGGALALKGGNETGTTSTGGALTLDAGTGTTTNGAINIGNNVAGTINLGFAAGAKTINIGTNTGPDTVNIGTGGTNADTITVGNTTVATTLTFNTGVSSTTGLTIAANSVNTGTGASLAVNGITTGKGLTITSTSTTATTGNLLNVSGITYAHTAAETGSLVSLAFSDTTSAAFATTSNGLKITPTINTTAANARTFNGLTVVPTLTACGTTAGTCTYSSFETDLPALTQTTTNTFNLNGLNLASAGALVQNTAAGTINWKGLNVVAPTSTTSIASGVINADGFKITTGNISQLASSTVTENGITVDMSATTITTGGTLTGLSITPPTTAQAAGTTRSLSLGTSTSATANTYDFARIDVGNIASTATNNFSTLELRNGGTGFFDLELVRGMINYQQMNTFLDDFTDKVIDTTNRWTFTAIGGTPGTCSTTITAAGLNGFLRAQTNTTAGGGCNLSTQATASNGFYQRGNNPVFESKVKVTSATMTGVRSMNGFANALLATGVETSTTNHAWIGKVAADTAWQCVSSDGTTESKTTTGVTITTGTYYRLRVQVLGGTTPQVICTVDDGTTVTRISKTTNVPLATTAMDIYEKCETSDATGDTCDYDYVRAWQDDPPLALENANYQSSVGLETDNHSASESAQMVSAIAGISSLSIDLNGLKTTSGSTNSATLDNINTQSKTVNLKVAGLATISGELTADSLHIKNTTIFDGMVQVLESITSRNLIVTEWAKFLSDVIFKGNVNFEGRPTFNKDTAGFAVVKKDAAEVEVKFDKEYAQTPLVNISITLDDNLTEQERALLKPEEIKAKEDAQKAVEQTILAGDIKYIVTRRTTTGFIIKLNKPAVEEIKFSWTTLAVKDAKTAVSNGISVLGAQSSPVPSSTPTLSASATPTPSPSVSPSPAPLKTATINQNELGYLRVRVEPSATASEVGQVNPGQSFSVLEEKGGWLKIEYTSGKFGWVSGAYATIK